MNLLAWLPHFRTDYLAVYPADCGCGTCKAGILIGPQDVANHDVVLQLSAFMAFGRAWRPRVTRIQ